MNNSRIPTVEIDMNKPCKECGQMGALPNGLCMKCLADAAFTKKKSNQGRRFRKIKVAKSEATARDRIVMEFEKPNGPEFDEYALTSGDKAAPEFHTALQALAQDVVEMCELPDDYRQRIVVKSVSLSYGGENSVMGATITAQMMLKKSNPPLMLNTPHKAEDYYAESGDPKQLLDPACMRRIHALIIEAEQFIDGKREQTDMFAKSDRAA